ncbi:hypothetical protein [Streptomyces sporangiiformans]|uniref:Uncharacterized protein n=1 Tax=Streptomyces sporangiiformans TaxID=2315329 RepID=A0A505DQX3_9ACTN|nr:hypothetical protein [Streptomyces sporangiiformans]TPQ23610.1 hypothetical protein FGD71_003265 [Streptomyces sporangiiformans]
MRDGGSRSDTGDDRDVDRPEDGLDELPEDAADQADEVSERPADTADEPPAEVGGRFGPLRRHRRLVVCAAALVLAAGVSVPLALAYSGGDKSCWQLPASTRALADDPAAATEAFDPGEDLKRFGSTRKLLAHEKVCGDGARALGRVVNAATRAAGPGEPHTMAQARSAYAVAAALHGVELPDGLAPGVARMLAEYVVDVGRDDRIFDDQVTGPAVPAEGAQPDERGYVWLGRFLAPREAHVTFGYGDSLTQAAPDIEILVAELAKDPEAFAILYDAERACFAHYLERLTDEGGNPDFRGSTDKRFPSTDQDWPDNDIEDLSGRIGNLMKYRARYARDGTIPDLAAFDKAVRAHTRGTYRPASRQLGTRPPMGDIADRPVTGPVRGDLMDGRHQLATVLAGWAKERNVSDERASAMRQLMDDGYVRALWLM